MCSNYRLLAAKEIKAYPYKKNVWDCNVHKPHKENIGEPKSKNFLKKWERKHQSAKKKWHQRTQRKNELVKGPNVHFDTWESNHSPVELGLRFLT